LLYKDDYIIGCGFLIQIHPDYKFYDLGIWVNPEDRRKGYALQIMLYMKALCLKNNWIPICGRDIQNIASQKTLEKAGFIGKHSLIEYQVK
jgi:RimJ/RimL family protein N-acetyltransferase